MLCEKLNYNCLKFLVKTAHRKDSHEVYIAIQRRAGKRCKVYLGKTGQKKKVPADG